MRQFINIVDEAVAIQTHNFDKPGSFDDSDRKIYNNPKSLQKVIKKWVTSVCDVNLVLLNLPDESGDDILNNIDYDTETVDSIKNDWGIDFPFRKGTLNVLLLNNAGVDKMPLTAWMVGHRIWHAIAIARDSASEIVMSLRSPLGDVLRAIGSSYNTSYAAMLGRSRACRENKLATHLELLGELFSEYMLFGKVRLNRLRDGLPGWDVTIDAYESLEQINRRIDEFEKLVNTTYASAIKTAKRSENIYRI